MNKHTATHALAHEIAKQIGKGWSYDRKRSADGDGNLSNYAAISGPNGAELSVTLIDYPKSDVGKAEVRGRTVFKDISGDHLYSDKPTPSIKVSVARGAETIASEIKRRLLPDYLSERAALQARLDARNTHLAAQASLVSSVASLIGARVHAHDSSRLHGEVGSASVSARVSSDTLSLELSSLTFDQARAVVRALKAVA